MTSLISPFPLLRHVQQLPRLIPVGRAFMISRSVTCRFSTFPAWLDKRYNNNKRIKVRTQKQVKKKAPNQNQEHPRQPQQAQQTQQQFQNGPDEAWLKSQQLQDAIKRSKVLRDDAMKKSLELRDKTVERSLQIKDRTLERSLELRDRTIRTSKKFKDNITKILPPDIHENIYTLPNFLTATRLICAPIVGYAILHGHTAVALSLFVYSCITDFLDGLIARHWNLTSVVGSIVDPIADKALMVICTVCLSITSEVPLYLATLILGRDIMLGLAGVVIRYATLPTPKTVLRYFDFSIITVEVHPVMISKVNTALQMVYLGVMMVKPYLLTYLGVNYGDDAIGTFLRFVNYFEWTVAATTTWSGLTYMFSRKAVKLLTPITWKR